MGPMTRLDSSEFWDPHFKDDGDASSDSSDPSQVLAELSYLRLVTDEDGDDDEQQPVVEFQDALENHNQWYGRPLQPDAAMDAFPPSSNHGLIWRAEVVPNQWWTTGTTGSSKLLQGLKARDFDLDHHGINPHRGTLPLTQEDLLSSITTTPDGRLIFSGQLNGWPQLSVLELVALERKRPLPFNKAQYTPHWTHSKGKIQLEDTVTYRATFAGPGWTAIGWSEASPGFVFWFESTIPRFTYGTNLLHTLSREEQVTRVHMISHRYAIQKESPRDLLTYHSVVLLEWDHGKYATVVEGAYLNGIGGYKCRSNWYEDRDEKNNLLSRYMPPELIGPWRTSAGEIRCYDLPQTTIQEFMAYMERFKGNDARFVDPQVTFSHVARLTSRTKRDLAQYLLNYVGRDCSYQELRKNCQTLAADLCAFLAGKKSVDPFHPLVKMEYRNRSHQFLYDSNMYVKTKKQRR